MPRFNYRRSESLPTRYPAGTDIFLDAANDGHRSREALPRTLEEAGRMFRERGLELREC